MSPLCPNLIADHCHFLRDPPLQIPGRARCPHDHADLGNVRGILHHPDWSLCQWVFNQNLPKISSLINSPVGSPQATWSVPHWTRASTPSSVWSDAPCSSPAVCWSSRSGTTPSKRRPGGTPWPRDRWPLSTESSSCLTSSSPTAVKQCVQS